MELVSRFIDRVIDENNKVVSGNDTLPIQKSHFLTFERKINFLDKEAITRCPSCGYPVDIHASGKCTYCGTNYNLEEKDWNLTKMVVGR